MIWQICNGNLLNQAIELHYSIQSKRFGLDWVFPLSDAKVVESKITGTICTSYFIFVLNTNMTTGGQM